MLISSTEKFLMSYLNQQQHEEKKAQIEEKPAINDEVMEVTVSNQQPAVIRISEGHQQNQPPEVIRISEPQQQQAAVVEQTGGAPEDRLQFLVIQSIKSASEAFLAERENVQSNYAKRFGRSKNFIKRHMETVSTQISGMLETISKKTRSKSKNKENDKSIEDEVQKILSVPMNLDKGGQVKIASSNLEGVKLTKRMRKNAKDGASLKRRKLDENAGELQICRREGNKRYESQDSMEFETGQREQCRDNNDLPESFFTNEFCQICNQGGDMLICENCPKVYHLKCAGYTSQPKGDFICGYCKGTQVSDCAKCCKHLLDYDQFHAQQQKDNLIYQKKIQILPAQCSLCLSKIHLECLDIPLKLLLKGAYYYNLKEKDYAELQLLYERFKLLDIRTSHQEVCTIKARMIELLQGDECFYYICYSCQESRQIDVICDVHCENFSDQSNLEEDIDLHQCYCLVKFKSTAYVHAIWVDFTTVECLGKTKLQGFNTKYRLKTYGDLYYHQQALKMEDYGDKFHNIDIQTMIPFRILDLFQRGKYYFIKWNNQDYCSCTWEPAYFVNKHCPELKYDLMRILQAQDIINDVTFVGACYRFDLMRSRDLQQQLIPYTPFNETPHFLNKGNVNLKLHEYQIQGLNWLINSWMKKTNVILADEMGLGKTVQAISFISYLINVQQISRPFLIVVPQSTLDNWIREFKTWCPEARLVSYVSGEDGKSRISQRDLEFFFQISAQNMKSPSFKALQIPKFNVVLTTYQILVSDFKHLSSIPWRCIIIDEGQRLKCSDSKLFKYALTLVAEYRILLSGTPLQNNVGELFNLLEYLDPVKFSAETRESFAKMFAESVMLQNHEKIFQSKKQYQNSSGASTEALTGSQDSGSKQPDAEMEIVGQPEGKRDPSDLQSVNIEKEKNALDQLQQLLAPHILRRFKRDVFKTFPKKKEVILRVEMTQKQRVIAKSLLEKNLEVLTLFEKQKTNQMKVSLRHADNILMQLRQIANHPLHLTDIYGTEQLRAKSTSKQTIDEQLSQLKTVQDYIRDSGKLQYLDRMMDLMFEKGHRILLFTQFRGSLDILSDYLAIKGVKHLRLDGETENLKRQKMIDLFNAPDSQYNIFLLSTKAGGLGINLTTADTIVIFDSDFNPHNDVQALNRAHRIGQKNNVMVYRLVCKNSVEERIIEAAKHKLMLDTMMTHSNQNAQKKEEDSNSLYQILKFGTKKLFEDSKLDSQETLANQTYALDEQKLLDILDRDKQFKALEEEERLLGSKDDGVKDYLSGFKVASIEKKVELPLLNDLGRGPSEESVEEDKDDGDQIFQKLMAQMKEKEVAENPQQSQEIEEEGKVEEAPIVISIQDPVPTIQTRRQRYGNKLEPKANEKQVDLEKLEKQIEKKGNGKPEKPAEAQKEEAKQKEVFYHMTPEYAQFIGGLPTGESLLYHDVNLYLTQNLGDLVQSVNKAESDPFEFQKDSETRIVTIKETKNRLFKNQQLAIKNKNVNKEFFRFMYMNENENLKQALPFINICGFDMQAISDYVHTYLEFGVKNKNLHKFYNKTIARCESLGTYSSLCLVSQQSFHDFSALFMDFWSFLWVHFPASFMQLPHFLFDFKTGEHLTLRTYEIQLLRSFLISFEQQGLTLEYLTNTYHALSWDPHFDSYLVAKLLLKYGFSNIHGVISDQVWGMLHPKTLAHIEFQNGETLKQVVKQVRHMKNQDIDQVLEKSGISLVQRQGRVRVLQKLSGHKLVLDAEKPTGPQLQEIQLLCVAAMATKVDEIIKRIKEIDLYRHYNDAQ